LFAVFGLFVVVGSWENPGRAGAPVGLLVGLLQASTRR